MYSIDFSCSDLPRTMNRLQFKKHFHARRSEMRWLRDKKKWLSQTAICSHCSREVSNREFWGENGKGSTHLKGTCKPETFFPVKIPRQSWKSKLAYPMPTEPNYRTYNGFSIPRLKPGSIYNSENLVIETMADFCKFWGVNNVGGTICA